MERFTSKIGDERWTHWTLHVDRNNSMFGSRYNSTIIEQCIYKGKAKYVHALGFGNSHEEATMACDMATVLCVTVNGLVSCDDMHLGDGIYEQSYELK
eukprot:5585473-Karenia_brevis.AAC.1